MITPKQRATLRSMANTMEPIFQIGKDDLSDALIEAVASALEKRELIKLSILQTATVSAKEAAQAIAAETGADIVQCIGRRFVLYRESETHKHIEL